MEAIAFKLIQARLSHLREELGFLNAAIGALEEVLSARDAADILTSRTRGRPPRTRTPVARIARPSERNDVRCAA